MKKAVYRKKRVKWFNVLVGFFFITCLCYLASSVGLKSYNVSLAAQQKEYKSEIVQTKAEVDALTIQVKQLSDYNRVMETVTIKGLTTNATVVSISN